MAAGWFVRVVPSGVEEGERPGERPAAAARRLAREKTWAVAAKNPGEIVLGADTMVVCEQRIFGKPDNRRQAEEMLRRLSGRRHDVITGVALLRLDRRGRTELDRNWHCRSQVYFRHLSEETIGRYLDRIDFLDKAGGYAIQESGELVIERIEGSRSNIIGLPIEQVTRILHADAKINLHSREAAIY